MILSHRHKFIFLKTSKTAGTSIEIALSQICGEKDVITPIAKEDEELRQSLGYRPPQNYLPEMSRLRQKPNRQLAKQEGFFNHIPGHRVRSLVNAEVWNSYFKFCVARNPWDRVISQYYWRHQQEPRPDMTAFIQGPQVQTLMRKGYPIYTHNDEVLVDHICRFENLEQEMRLLSERLNLGEEIRLLHAKAKSRADNRHYRAILNKNQADLIATIFSKEIDLLGYAF
jgi:hypothetical protein